MALMPPVGVSAGRLNAMRTAAQKMMPDTCTIRNAALVSDGSGGKQAGWTSHTGEPCRFDPLGAQSQSSLGLNVNVTVYEAVYRWNAPLTADSEVDHGGHAYEVYNLADDQTPLIYRRAYMIRVDPAP